jgi:hypothetical protein
MFRWIIATLFFVIVFSFMCKWVEDRRQRIRSEMKFKEGQEVRHVTDHAPGIILRVNPDCGGFYVVRFSKKNAYEDMHCKEFELYPLARVVIDKDFPEKAP